MPEVNLDGGVFHVADFADLTDHAAAAEHAELGAERLRLLGTYVRFGRGLRTVIDAWAPNHPDLLDERREAFAAEHPQLEPNPLMLAAQAWQLWYTDNAGEAETLQDEITPRIWNDVLTPSEKVMFLAVTKALSTVNLLPLVYRVRRILGEGSGSGTHQFRLLTNLHTAALARIRSGFDGPSSSIHHGYPVSFRQKRDALPRLQVCTRQLAYTRASGEFVTWAMTDRGADIDIDYRGLLEGHLDPGNSNVAWADDDFKNWRRHVDAFGDDDPGLQKSA